MSRYARSSAWIIAVALSSLTYVAGATEHAIRRYIIVHGSSITGSWDDSDSSNEELRNRFGDRFAWFRKDHHEYVITASSVLDELDRAMEPQENVNRMQADVNREQGRVNEMQAGVNAHQHEVNAMQARVNANEPGIDQPRVNRKQADVNAEQSGVNAEQSKVNAMQKKVNEEQHRVSAEIERSVQEIFEHALQNGAAKELR